MTDTAPEVPTIIVSNRLPVSLEIHGSRWRSRPSSGGLVSALEGLEDELDSDGKLKWVGWPSRLLEPIHESLAADGMIAVPLSKGQERGFYQGMCNEVLWPLFHYFADKVRFEPEHWKHYSEANRRFADAVLENAEEGSRVWVHDYHLMLVPALLREARPDLEIGFFLHVPWPSSELYRLLPPRRGLLRGLLGADYVAFHTSDYAMHFRTSCMRVLGLESDPNGIPFEGRMVGIGRHPIGLDAVHFRDVMGRPKTHSLREEFRQRYQGQRLLLDVSRLDYSKGIPLRLQAFETLLLRRPKLSRETTLLQVVVPSRTGTPEYDDLREQIEQQVARINGRFGEPGFTPVDYIYRFLTPEELVALYQVADVAVITPIRDGMNLVAQEFVFCHEDQAGMIVLSEFAGSAHCLNDAILVNPWNIEKTSRALEQALDMSKEERDERMQPMIERVTRMDCRAWARGFLDKLAAAGARRRQEQSSRPLLSGAPLSELKARFATAPERLLIIDYDGTLMELKRRPEEARPTPEILDLLRELAALPNTTVHLVSGRQTDALDRWFGDLDIHMGGEHGTMVRRPGAEDWEPRADFRLDWRPAAEATLAEVTSEVLGSWIERKRHTLAWHYREADLEYGLWSAAGLIMRLESDLQHVGVEVIHGHRVVEVRPVGANKGQYVRHVTQGLDPDTLVLCLGDDRTDLDMYDALRHISNSLSIHVGGPAENADWMLGSPTEVRALLSVLVKACQARSNN
jgi:trehalose 6-phosphate synthase/phosphatase